MSKSLDFYLEVMGKMTEEMDIGNINNKLSNETEHFGIKLENQSGGCFLGSRRLSIIQEVNNKELN